MPATNNKLRSCLRNPNAPAVHAERRTIRYAAQHRTRLIPPLDENLDPFPQDAVPNNVATTHRPEHPKPYKKGLTQSIRYSSRPGDCINFPPECVSQEMQLHVQPDGTEKKIPMCQHPRYAIAAAPFDISSIWVKPVTLVAAPDAPAVALTDEQKWAMLANAGAEQRVMFYHFIECSFINRTLAGEYGMASRKSLILRRKDASLRLRIPTEAALEGLARSSIPWQEPQYPRTPLAPSPPSDSITIPALNPVIQPPVATGSSKSTRGTSTSGGMMFKVTMEDDGMVRYRPARRTFHEDELRSLKKEKNAMSEVAALTRGKVNREVVLAEDEADVEGKCFAKVVGTNQWLFGLSLIDVPGSVESGEGEDAGGDASTSSSGAQFRISNAPSPPARDYDEPTADASTVSSVAAPAVGSPSTSTMTTTRSTTLPPTASTSTTPAVIDEDLIGLSLDELRAMMADARSRLARSEATLAESKAKIADLDEDITEAETILESEPTTFDGQLSTPAAAAGSLASNIDAFNKRIEERDLANAAKAATQEQQAAAHSEVVTPSSSSELSAVSSSSTPPRPLPRALIPLQILPWRRALDRFQIAPTAPAELDGPDGPRPLSRQHALGEREEDYVSPFPHLANLSAQERLVIETQLENENMLRRQESLARIDGVAFRSQSPLKRQRGEDEDDGENGSPTAKRARSETPLSAERSACSSSPVPSFKHQGEDDAAPCQADAPPSASIHASAPSSPTPSLKRKRSEDHEKSSFAAQPSTPPQMPSKEEESPTPGVKRARSLDWCTIV